MNQHQQIYADYAKELNEVLNGGDLPELFATVELLEKAFHEGKKVFIAGNGGSAATASHMMADFQKTTLGKSYEIAKRLKAIALSDNVPLITAWGNDASYNHIFAEQLRTLGEEGDLLLVITASGNSPNILEALNVAKSIGITTIGFLGFDGGKSKPLCDVALVVPSKDYGVIEDAHAVFMHMATAALKKTVQA